MGNIQATKDLEGKKQVCGSFFLLLGWEAWPVPTPAAHVGFWGQDSNLRSPCSLSVPLCIVNSCGHSTLWNAFPHPANSGVCSSDSFLDHPEAESGAVLVALGLRAARCGVYPERLPMGLLSCCISYYLSKMKKAWYPVGTWRDSLP